MTVKAREMGFKTKFSASEVAEAMNYMAMVGKVISAIGTIMTIVPKVSGVINVVKEEHLSICGITARDSGSSGLICGRTLSRLHLQYGKD